MSALKDSEKRFLRLILRSKDIGDGWRNVSLHVWTLVADFKRKELIEAERFEAGAGKVRLSERGRIVVEYI